MFKKVRKAIFFFEIVPKTSWLSLCNTLESGPPHLSRSMPPRAKPRQMDAVSVEFATRDTSVSALLAVDDELIWVSCEKSLQ